jgi:predicted cobalt transporter CbtA
MRVESLLLRGMLVGVLAGFLACGFSMAFGEPLVDRAIAFEEHLAQQRGEAPEPELVSRGVQSTLGLLTGVVVYGAGLGGLFALVFACAYGRVGGLRPRTVAALVAGAAWVAVYLVPSLKYPANPPSVGAPETIGYRTGLYFFMVVLSVATMAFAVVLGRRLVPRLGDWNAALVAGATFIAMIAIIQALLPTIDEVPTAFPAVLLWQFRLASLGAQMVLWGAIGLLFGALTERSLPPATS